MSEKVLARGFATAVRFWSPGPSDVCFGAELYDVPDAEADKALAANRAGKKIEIVQPDGGCWKDRTVRLVPVVVVKARGTVDNIRTTTREVWISKSNPYHSFQVTNISDAARAFADAAEVEIVSVDGGPDMVRRVS